MHARIIAAPLGAVARRALGLKFRQDSDELELPEIIKTSLPHAQNDIGDSFRRE
jgi:hypothetical protein